MHTFVQWQIEIQNFQEQGAKWVADEQWHPRQKRIHNKDGSLELQLPYSDSWEILKDILKLGHEVAVLAPEELRNETITRRKAAFGQYK